MVSKQMERIKKVLRSIQKTSELDVETFRNKLIKLSSMVMIPKDVICEPIKIGDISAEWITMSDANIHNVILYLHGGAYIAGSINTHRELASRLSRASKTRILIIDYRLAPEYCFPAAIDDAIAAYNWLINVEKINPTNLIIAGDSAGGGLTLAALINIRDEGVALPVAAICLSPWTDLALTGESMKIKVEDDPFISPELGEFSVNLYLRGENPRNPLASPLYADLQGLPPLFIQVGTSEILLDDSVRFAERAKNAGVDVELDIWEEMIHVFAAFAALTPEGQQAIEKIGEFIQKSFK